MAEQFEEQVNEDLKKFADLKAQKYVETKEMFKAKPQIFSIKDKEYAD